MTTTNWNKTTPLNNFGASLYEWRFCTGADTPPSLRNKGILNENAYTANIGFDLNQPLKVAGFESNVRTAGGGWNAWSTPAVPSNVKALSNLLEKFKQSDFNLAVSAGESRESWHMISDRMFSFAEALRRTKRGDLSGALRAMGSSKRVSRRAQRKLDTGDVSGSFLELQYGWVPLMNDIYAASELINSPKIERSSIRTSDRTSAGDRVTSLTPSQIYSKTFQNERTIYHVAKLTTKEVNMAVRLGLTNPLPIIWELTTLSFVADWFLPIGDLIQAVEASYILPVGRYIKSDVLRQHCQFSLSPGDTCWQYGSTAFAKSSGVRVVRQTVMNRTVATGVPSNIYDGTGPRQSMIDLDLSLSQMASASALLHQAFKAFRR